MSHFFGVFLDVFFTISRFFFFRAPQLRKGAPKTPQERSKTPLRRPKGPQRGTQDSQDLPRRTQDHPRHHQDIPKTPQGPPTDLQNTTQDRTRQDKSSKSFKRRRGRRRPVSPLSLPGPSDLRTDPLHPPPLTTPCCEHETPLQDKILETFLELFLGDRFRVPSFLASCVSSPFPTLMAS